ncbi:hypothetical protein OG948_34225 (plasmid) [Embleya sp. NBC_00888]|uniref:hypothetical protein n=1 Tax=Embleya sp. NBC_00888 TaxID=2975960 RepID=UPI0038659709|nr:hypothetical protein OG948_34225 [Embleya sp. NBC_00888]
MNVTRPGMRPPASSAMVSPTVEFVGTVVRHGFEADRGGERGEERRGVGVGFLPVRGVEDFQEQAGRRAWVLLGQNVAGSDAFAVPFAREFPEGVERSGLLEGVVRIG